jgi:vitamin K-dependent gamma-carboxylase
MTDAAPSHRQRLWAGLGAPRDIAAIAAFRVTLGAIVVISSLRFLSYGWIDELYNKPGFHLRYWGFGWVPLPSPAVTTALFVATGVLGLLVALGLCYRLAAALLFLAFTYLQLVDVATYLNHYYLVSLFAALLVVIPAHRAASLDALLRPGIRAATLPAWCTYLLRFQVAVVYVNAGLAKATTDWLLHAQPLNIWLSARTGLPVVGPYLDLPGVAHVAAWAGFLFDTTIVLFLLWRRTRTMAYLAVLGFHAVTHLLFPPIGMFPIIMVVAATVFFDASWPRRWLRAATPARVAAAPAVHMAGGRRLRIAAAAAGAYMLVQILVPLRAHAYGGNVLWHEQGMRFSWRVMARAKNGSVTFIVRDPKDGRQWHVSPAKYLTPIQEREMAVQPDLILQLAHHIAREFEAAGRPGVEVHADARASLNGRPAAVLVDPATDLAREQDGIGRKRWILPAPDIEPPHLRRSRSRTL